MAEDRPPREEYLAHEDDLLRDLLAFAETTRSATLPIEINRPGAPPLRFQIRPLIESEYVECREKATTYGKNRQFGGLRVAEDLDMSRLSSHVIYAATLEADRARLWDNKALQRKLDVLSGPDVIDRLLRAGEKDAVVNKIQEISGFGVDLEQQAKN